MLDLWSVSHLKPAKYRYRFASGGLTEAGSRGSNMISKGFAIAAALAAASAFAGSAEALDRRVRVVNNTSQTMVKLQASNIGTNSWEEDILGSGVLASGRAITVNMNDGTGYCVFDLKATFRSGATAIRRRVNICQVGTWTIND
jgi:hypothetical protein